MAPPDPKDAAERVVPEGWDLEVAERFGYSFAVRRGRTLWIAGQVSLDERGNPIGIGDIEHQARVVLERIRTIVETAGGSMADVVRTTTYITDREHRPITNQLRREYFDGPVYPTNTLLVVAALALPEYLVEIEATAILPA